MGFKRHFKLLIYLKRYTYRSMRHLFDITWEHISNWKTSGHWYLEMKVMEYNWDKIWWFKLIIRLLNTVQTTELAALESSQSQHYCGFVVFFMRFTILDIIENACKTRCKNLKTVFRIILIFVVLVFTPIYFNY